MGLYLRGNACNVCIVGDFDVPASRGDVDRDSMWNQWLRSELHLVFVQALQHFKVSEDRDFMTEQHKPIRYEQYLLSVYHLAKWDSVVPRQLQWSDTTKLFASSQSDYDNRYIAY